MHHGEVCGVSLLERSYHRVWAFVGRFWEGFKDLRVCSRVGAVRKQGEFWDQGSEEVCSAQRAEWGEARAVTGEGAAVTHISQDREEFGILCPGPCLCFIVFHHGHRVALPDVDVL